jgi:hypothetical protein
MGDIVRLSEVRSSRPSRRAETEVSVEATITFFTGVRIERWDDGETGPGEAPQNRPTPPRRRRRRT